MQTVDTKLAELKDILRKMGGVLVAYSWGVDSTLLLCVAHETLGDRALGVTICAEIHAPHEIERAQRVARQLGARAMQVKARVLDIEGFAASPPDRCYICKTALFTKLMALAAEQGLPYVADGSNTDDSKDFRPGHRALEELGVRSPLAEAGFSKAEIRELSRQLGLETWDLPAAACLASRFPYGTQVTERALTQVAQAEAVLRELGFAATRVRHHVGGLARIEVPAESIPLFVDSDLRHKVIESLRGIGYTYVSLDLQGYRMGSLNETLTPEQREALHRESP